jgi:imidazolonepropionase-like amidohydrolase
MTRRTERARTLFAAVGLLALAAVASPSLAQVAVRGGTVYTMAGPPIQDGVVLIRDGKIVSVGPADSVAIPDGYRVLEAEVVTPGLVDAHTVVGLSGSYNYPHDQDQLERSSPIQPQLRAIDAYNAEEALVAWVRSFGVTTIHTGHAPGELVSGQTMIAKTRGDTVETAALVESAAVAATLSPSARKSGAKSPGTRAKMVSMLREKLIRGREYLGKKDRAGEDEPVSVDLELESFGRVLRGEIPLVVTCHRAQDIMNALRLAREFEIDLVLDGAAEAYVVLDEIREAGVPVFLHPTMLRAYGETENMSFETAGRLRDAGIPFALQSGYESYVPKTRVVLFEAAFAAANGLGFEDALAAITIEAARILGIDDRVGSLEAGKDGDVALYDGDPFEYTSHCIGVVIEGEVVSETPR